MTHFIRTSVANRMAILAAVPLALAICLFLWQVHGGTAVFAQTGSDDAILTSCTASPENPRSGDTVTLSAQVENVSAGDTRADLYVGFAFNDARTGSVGTEPEFVAKGGSFTFTRTVDAGGIHLPVGTNTVECYLIWFDNGRNHDMDRTGPGRRLPNATVTVLPTLTDTPHADPYARPAHADRADWHRQRCTDQLHGVAGESTQRRHRYSERAGGECFRGRHQGRSVRRVLIQRRSHRKCGHRTGVRCERRLRHVFCDSLCRG